MKRVSFGSVIIMSVLCCDLLAAPEVFNSMVQVHGEPVHVTLARDKFEQKGHTFKRGSNGSLLVDGIRAIGTDSLDPQWHLSRFEVDWNGRKITMPHQFFEFVFNPSLEKKANSFDDKGSALVIPSKTDDSVLIMLSGGDGAGAFNGWWIVRKDGRISQFSDGPP